MKKPTFPLNAGSNRSLNEVMGREIFLEFHPIPVRPDCHGRL